MRAVKSSGTTVVALYSVISAGPGKMLAGLQALAVVNRRLQPAPLAPHGHRVDVGVTAAVAVRHPQGTMRHPGRPYHLDAHVDDLRRPRAVGIAVTALVPTVKLLAAMVAPRHHQLERLAHVAHVNETADLDGLRRNAFLLHRLPTARLQLPERRLGPLARQFRHRDQQGLSVFLHVVGHQHAVGRQNAGMRRHQHRGNGQPPRQIRRVHAAGAAERHQGELARVVAALHRDDADGAFHIGVHHFQDALAQHLRAQAGACREIRHRRPGARHVQSHVAAQESVRVQAAQVQAGVGDGQPRALAVTHRTRIGAGAPRADLQRAARIDGGQRAAARPHRVDVQHRHLDRTAGYNRLRRRARLFLAQRHVRGSAAHVERDDVGIADLAGAAKRPHNAARRAGQHRVHGFLVRPRRRHHPAIGTHHPQLGALQRLGQTLQVTLHHRAQIGVHHGGAAALVLAKLRQHLMRHRHGYAESLRRLRDGRLVHRVGIGVQQADGQ